MKILAITIGDRETGSSKYRLFQYEDILQRGGIEFEYIERGDLDRDIVKKAEQADLVYNQKCLIRTALARKIAAVARRVAFDVDDAIWTRPHKSYSLITQVKVERRFQVWLKHGRPLIAANEYLADYVRAHGGEVTIIPNALDLSVWYPRPRAERDTIHLGWAGAPCNVKYLEGIEPALALVLSRFPEVRLKVYGGQRPSLSIPHEHTPFSLGTEQAFMTGIDIGLLPLEDDEYLNGKSSIKAIQYLACGIPVVGNVYGGTAEIVNAGNGIAVYDQDEWVGALTALIEDEKYRARLGQGGLASARAKHDRDKVGERLLAILRG